MLDVTIDFLTAILPARKETEVYRVEIFPPAEPYANNFVSLAEMADYLLRWGVSPRNAYFALATFPRAGRDRRGAHALRFACAWADLDVGPTKNYSSKTDALGAVEAFCLAPSALVDSGRGVHAYWLLESPVEGTEIDRLLGLVAGLASVLDGDGAVALRSQILRPPGTWNVDSVKRAKDGLNHPVQLLRLDGQRRYTLNDLEAAGVVPPRPPVLAPMPGEIAAGQGRHRSLVTEASRLRNLGYDACEIDGALQVLNRRRCSPPKSEEEVRAISEWAGHLPLGLRAHRDVPIGPQKGPLHVA